VTVFVNGRAGLGPDMASALRQALNEPPRIDVRRPRRPATVGERLPIRFEVENARREIVTISSGTQHGRAVLGVANGPGVVRWEPHAAGRVRVVVTAVGLDGTRISDRAFFQVLDRPPVIRVLGRPKSAVVGRPLQIRFEVRRGRRASVRVSTRAGIVFARRYLLVGRTGVVAWTPDVPGRVEVLLRARGRQGQVTRASLHLRVRPHATTVPPSVELVSGPRDLVTGTPARFALRADGCQEAIARIRNDEGVVQVWRLACPFAEGTFDWNPDTAGTYRLTVVAEAEDGSAASQTVGLRVRAGTTASPSPGRRSP
jgi:hypothetical protein